KAVEMLTEAAGLGSIDALFNLGAAHEDGVGVQQDEAKAVEFYAKAAMQGHVLSRYSLGFTFGKKGGELWPRGAPVRGATLYDLSENGAQGFS
ncbi:hypothetical protein THAOC_14783, partial [Thalassiosira oceanica]